MKLLAYVDVGGIYLDCLSIKRGLIYTHQHKQYDYHEGAVNLSMNYLIIMIIDK